MPEMPETYAIKPLVWKEDPRPDMPIAMVYAMGTEYRVWPIWIDTSIDNVEWVWATDELTGRCVSLEAGKAICEALWYDKLMAYLEPAAVATDIHA